MPAAAAVAVAQWEWKATENVWKQYDAVQSEAIEAAYTDPFRTRREGGKLNADVTLNTGRHAIDFTAMRQFKVDDPRRSRHVRRQELSPSPSPPSTLVRVRFQIIRDART